MGVDMRDIGEVAETLGVDRTRLVPCGRHKAKVELGALTDPPRGRGRLVVVSAITRPCEARGRPR